MKKQHKSIVESEKRFSIVFIALLSMAILTVLITLHVDGKFSSWGEEASHMENVASDDANALCEDVELLTDLKGSSSEIHDTEDKIEEPLKIYVKNPSIESIGTETPIVSSEESTWIYE